MGVQYFDVLPRPTSASMLGEGLGGLAGSLAGQAYKEKRLSDAFSGLQNAPQGDYLSQLSAIAPTLLTTPGGAELLGQLAPLLSRSAQSRIQQQAIQNRRGPLPEPAQQAPQMEKAAAKNIQPQDISRRPESPEDVYRQDPTITSDEGVYPQRTTGSRVEPLMNPGQVEDFALNVMAQSEAMGTPISYQDAMNLANTQNQQRASYNEQILREQQLRDAMNKQMSEGVVERAIQSGLIKTQDGKALYPEEVTVIEKLANKYRNSPTPAEQYDNVRRDYGKYQTARESLMRMEDIPGPLDKFYRNWKGTFKQKEEMMKDAQPYLDQYRKLGLFNEAREILMTGMGLGREDAEIALFPFRGSQRKELESFQGLPRRSKPTYPGQPTESEFPGSENNLDPRRYEDFKGKVADYLKKNPSVNLLAMRGYLNQDKRYSWEDIKNAVTQLISEGEFQPDLIQKDQLPFIQQAPLPGMADIFKNFLKGTK